MTLLFMDGFDTKDLAAKWTLLATGSGTTTLTSSTRFSSGYAFTTSASVSSYGYTKSFTAASQVFVGAAIKAPVIAGQNYGPTFHVLAGDSGATWHLFLTVSSLGAVQVWRGDGHIADDGGSFHWAPHGTMLAASSNGVLDSNWHYVELGATINSSTGTAQVYVDGVQVINLTGANTKNGGTNNSIDTLGYFYLQYSTFTSVSAGAPTVDDLYVCNSSGSSPTNTFLGDVRVQTLLPTGAGTNTQLTPTGSGSNYANVNEVPDNPATYNGSATSGQHDTYAMGDLAAGTGTIYAVQQVMSAFKSNSGAASLKAAQLISGTLYYGATRTLGSSPTTYCDMFELNPDTSAAYTATIVNALEAGAEVV